MSSSVVPSPTPLRSPEQQLALQLFAELSPTNTSIKGAKADIGFNVSRVLVDVKELSLLASKAVSGCYYLAATSAPNPTGAYNYDLGFFKWLINYSSSNNIAHLKKVLIESQKSAVQVNIIDANKPGKDAWASVPLMGTVAIHGGRIMFKLPTELISELANPNGITMWLSLRLQANFSSIYAKNLFAKVVPLKDAGCTPWMALQEFAVWMNVDEYEWAKEYRYLHRDVIKVAMTQINEHSDIKLTLETQTARGTRRIEMIRFIIERKSDRETWESSVEGVITEQKIYEVLSAEFAMAPKDLDKVMARRSEWTNVKLWDAIEYTRNRLIDPNPNLEYVRKPGNYFMNALENGYRLVTPAKKMSDKANDVFEKERREKIRAAEKKVTKGQAVETDAVMAAFENLAADAQNELWSTYARSPAKSIIKSVEKSANGGESMGLGELLKIGRVRAGFAGFVQKHLAAQEK